MRINFVIWCLVACVSLGGTKACKTAGTQDLPLKYFQNQKDYSFMWWENSIKTGNHVFAIKTNRYALSFDYPGLSIQSLSIIRNALPEDMVLSETNNESFSEKIPFQLKFGLDRDGIMMWCRNTSGKVDDCQLVETGKYFQRRFITNLPDLKGCDPFNSGLEISSWPDRLAFILRINPVAELENTGMELRITFPPEFKTILEQGKAIALKNEEDGSGYVILKSANTTEFTVTGTTVTARKEKRSLSAGGMEINTGMIIYPVSLVNDAKMNEILELEENPLEISAVQIGPVHAALKVNYDKDLGWHQVILRSDKIESNEPPADLDEGNPGPGIHELNNRMERVLFSVENRSERDRVVRLNFSKGRLTPRGNQVFAVPGISAVLRDGAGFPVGIPVQLSKNWHSGGRSGTESHYFQGPWYHGLTKLTIPAKSVINLEYTSVNSLWGGVPAASHAQLCLVGWGHNQQWDESAIGAWGESITYEPDLGQAGAPVLDFRPLLLLSPAGEKWGWTGNMGGADFFNYTKKDGTREWHSRIRTQYSRYSPNLTEVTYSGTMDNGAMNFEYSASVGRSDDLTRGIYKIRLHVLKDVEFADFVFFQAAASTYHYIKSNTLAWGNESGLKEQWKSTIGGPSRYITKKKVAEGEIPWFSFTDSEFTTQGQGKRWLPSNRGFVIRHWNARVNGQDHTPPWFAEYNTSSGNHGGPSGLINIIPPEGCKTFKAGDFLEAEVVLFLVPSLASDYYGPNENLKKVLSEKANTWEMVYREAVGNDLDVVVTRGSLVDNYPIKIESVQGNVRFSVSGGCGYVPLIITGIDRYSDPVLYRKVDNRWVKVSQEVYGNDFWQTEMNARSGTWDITYNINLDSPNDKRRLVEFRFCSPGKSSHK
jgi:hypothetical protein